MTGAAHGSDSTAARHRPAAIEGTNQGAVRDVNGVHTPAALVADSTSAEITAFSAEKVNTFGAEHAHARAAT